MARQWQTVLVSIVAHVVAVFLLVVVPLLAFDGLPALRSAVEYVPVEMKIPDLPKAPQMTSAAPTTEAAPRFEIPTTAPDTIGPEVQRPLPTINVVGVPGGFDLPRNASAGGDYKIELPPPTVLQEPIRPGGKLKAPDRITYVRPNYPAIAISARISGSVVIEAVIGTDGVVRDATVLRSIPMLDDAALRAVRQWRYTPSLLNGVPVAVVMTVTVTFTLGSLLF